MLSLSVRVLDRRRRQAGVYTVLDAGATRVLFILDVVAGPSWVFTLSDVIGATRGFSGYAVKVEAQGTFIIWRVT